jgi:phospholipase D1/2
MSKLLHLCDVLPARLAKEITHVQRCQVVRSLGEWSGNNATENSIYQAYIHLIDNAKHYIYIENQYFISSLGGGGIENRIAEALFRRIHGAITHQPTPEVFRVIIICQAFPMEFMRKTQPYDIL